MPQRPPLRGLLSILLLAAMGAVLWLSLGRELGVSGTVTALRAQSGHWWAVPLYFVLYALLDILFIPTQLLSIAAALMWGWARGGTIELFAATLGAIPPYRIARTTFREWIAEKLQKHQRASAVLEREGFTLLLLLRVVPLIPYTPLNYVAGLTSVPLSRYVLATFIGLIPSTYIFAWFVQAIADGVVEPRDAALRAVAAGAAFAALIIATRLASPWLRRKMSSSRTASPQDGARPDSGSPIPPPE